MKHTDVYFSGGEDNPNERRPATGQVTSTSLLDRLRSDDTASWRRLAGLYGSLVYSWCRQKGLGAEDAADVVQEVFRAVSLHIGRFRHDRPGDSFRKWLKTIANNQINDHWRRTRRQPQAVGGTKAYIDLQQQPEPKLEAADDEAEINHLLRQALELVRAEFEPPTWQSFWQTAVDGRATQDVAAELGLSANAVRIARSRVRSRLRQEFGELLE